MGSPHNLAVFGGHGHSFSPAIFWSREASSHSRPWSIRKIDARPAPWRNHRIVGHRAGQSLLATGSGGHAATSMVRSTTATGSAGKLDYGGRSGPLRRRRNQTARCRYDSVPGFFAAPMLLESARPIARANGFLALASPVSLSEPTLSHENDRGACSRRATLRAQKSRGCGSVSRGCTFPFRRSMVSLAGNPRRLLKAQR